MARPSIVVISRAVGLDGEHRAGLGALAVDVHRARAAVARVAADVRAGQAEDVAQQVDEQEARLDVGLAGLAVDRERDVLWERHPSSAVTRIGSRALAARRRTPRALSSSRGPCRACSRPARGRRRRAGSRPRGRGPGLAIQRLARDAAADLGLGVGRLERLLRDGGEADADPVDPAVVVEASAGRPTPTVEKSPARRSSFW